MVEPQIYNMNNTSDLGIVSYGSYIPGNFVTGKNIEAAQEKFGSDIYKSLGVFQKSVPSIDEDTTTISVQSGSQAIKRFFSDSKSNNKNDISCLFIGSESHPYAVKPTGTMVKQALGLSDNLSMADLQFACKAGTQALQICFAYIGSGISKNGLAIGSDTAQSRPGDVLEYTAGAGSAAFLVGTQNIIAKLLGTASVATDTPDFWRRPRMKYPEHAGRFSGEPAYFYHIALAAKKIMADLKMKPKDFDYCVFHTPNAKFPKMIAKSLGFTPEQLKPSLVVDKIGNVYSAASLIALSSVLDIATKGQKILMVSYGSGSGSDAFAFETTSLLEKKRKTWKRFLRNQIESMKEVSYHTYIKNTE
ncbi:MAG: hydroxymethylglutaryl-CoA synthase [Candidatus Pacebacteria bacterium CG_4_9_14_0_2_um_filter_34_50]|nr:MAG: hydroxymethylglutaryl-CoA synthase [Candidatus Pacebacteria bacterium CG_4_9_14_0_2_um_filter_34_50]